MNTALSFNFAQKTTKPGRYFDSGTGLHLWVKAPSKKYWIFRYMRLGKRQDMSLGVFPLTSLSEARKGAMEARIKLAQGVNPIEEKRALKKDSLKEQTKFRDFAKSCIELKSPEWKNSKHGDQWTYTIEEFANPIIGDKPLNEITTEDILKILQPIWLNKTETASRLRGRLEWILASATTRKLREGINPAQWRAHLDTILPKPKKTNKTKHFKALHFSQVPTFISQLREREGISAIALEFAILTCARTGEVIGATRGEVQDGVWTISGERMKAGKEHRVPLTTRALELIEIGKYLDPDSPYLFSIEGKALSNMAMYSVAKRMGFDTTVHGFRSSFRDWVSELTDYPTELAEKALAHTIQNRVEAAYRRGDLLAKRLSLMEDWSDYCAQGSITNVVALKTA